MQKTDQKRKPATIQVLVRAVVRDKDGKIIYDSGQKPSESFVRSFLRFFGGLFDAVKTSEPDITNTSRVIIDTDQSATWSYCDQFFRCDGGAGVQTKGIMVGSGTTAPTNTDYALETRIAHGVGAGQLQYGTMTFGAVAVVGVNVDLELQRTFTNGSGATITVREVGIYVYQNDPSETAATHMICRDVITAVGVPDKCALTVYYTLRTTV